MKQFSRLFIRLGLTTLLLVDASATVLVNVDVVKLAARKAAIKLKLTNTLQGPIESARATVFLLDDHGKLAGQLTRWVIGGTKDRPPLPPGAETTFTFVIPVRQITTTNLHAKVLFNRVILEGGKVVDVNKFVTIEASRK